jgi:hypothetical protein
VIFIPPPIWLFDSDDVLEVDLVLLFIIGLGVALLVLGFKLFLVVLVIALLVHLFHNPRKAST